MQTRFLRDTYLRQRYIAHVKRSYEPASELTKKRFAKFSAFLSQGNSAYQAALLRSWRIWFFHRQAALSSNPVRGPLMSLGQNPAPSDRPNLLFGVRDYREDMEEGFYSECWVHSEKCPICGKIYAEIHDEKCLEPTGDQLP